MRDKVSIITPTYGREDYLAMSHRTVLAQTYRDFEWLVLDDSPSPSAYMQSLDDPRIKYRHSPERKPLGRKRNELIEWAQGSIIVQFDDDDYYSPRYIERMVRRLNPGFDVIALSGYYLYAVPFRAFGYWDLTRKVGRHYMWQPPHPIQSLVLTPENNMGLAHNHLGYGFSYVYRRKVWQEIPFIDDAHGTEDGLFAQSAEKAYRVHQFHDLRGLCLHILHNDNISRCFPQYRLPASLLRWIFPSAVTEYVSK
jgi:glycosyltransferase involved in cell wall biosynthesis